jgi:sulfur carrier protein ThiS
MVRASGKELAWREGMTLADVLAALEDSYPYTVARIGERIVTAPNFSSVSVPDGAEVFLLHLVAGG